MNDFLVSSAGFVAAASTLLLFLPQARVTWLNRHDSRALGGIATSTIWLSFIGAVAWLIYGAGIGAIWTMIPSFVNIPLTLFILFLIYRSRKQATSLEVEAS